MKARVLAALAALVLAPFLVPYRLAAFSRDPLWPTVLTDRHGVELRAARDPSAGRARWVPLAEIGPIVAAATVAAEDRRFRSHPGVDPAAASRALVQAARAGRVVSGASTLPMQVVRILQPHGGGLGGKLLEGWRAVRLDAWESKDAILEAYLNRTYYGRLAYGVEAAARTLFARPAARLSLAEAALVAVLPRAPSALDPFVHADRALSRRDRLLAAMESLGVATREDVVVARSEPLRLRRPLPAFEAPHFVEHVLPDLPRPGAGSRVETTLDLALQHDVETLVLRHLQRLEGRGVSQAAVVVLEVGTGDVLAMVGSAAWGDPVAGQVNGATALRQPGSALKPFTYALAFERGFTPATVLPDIEVHYATFKGDYEPENYDRGFRGPVRAREALASSLNVPAVRLLEQVGIPRTLERLKALGLASLARSPEHYGLGLTLGDGEVRLLDLANAYRVLARGGLYTAARTVRSVAARDGEPVVGPVAPARRVLDARAAFLVTDVLSDAAARAPTFGRRSVLDLPFPTAAKTGTSRGYRDNWTVGFTREIVVGAWAGNFDGAPMGEVTGVSGAGPLFHDVLIRAMRGRQGRPFVRPAGLVRAEVCALSGEMPTPACPGSVSEWFPATARLPPCAWHREVALDRSNGLLAGPACPPGEVERRPLAVLPPEYHAWAEMTGFPAAPTDESPRCRGGSALAAAVPPRPGAISPTGILFPPRGAAFAIDDELPRDAQAVHLQAAPPPGADTVVWAVDGRELARVAAPFTARWEIAPGAHRISIRALRDGAVVGEDAVRVTVAE